MRSSLALFASLLSLSGCHNSYSSGSYNSYGRETSYGQDSYGQESYRDKEDAYGSYHFDRLGYRTYTRCFDRNRQPRDQCKARGSSGYSGYGYNDNNYNGYTNNNRPSSSYDDDYYSSGRGKVNVGSGTYRILRNGRDAALTCEFPRGSNVVSNIVWERADRGQGYGGYGDNNYNRPYSRSDRYNSLRNNRKMEVVRIGDYGSNLVIKDFDVRRDTGIYRCLGTRSYDRYGSSSSYRPAYSRSYGRTETVFMEVEFYPNERETGYNGVFSGRDYYPSGSYWNDYGYRAAAVTSSEDTIVPTVNKIDAADSKGSKN